MKFQDKYPVRIRRFNDMLRADLRFLEQGVSISNEVKSILIGYNELKEMAIDESLYLHLFYIKTYDNGISYNYEVIECNEKIFKAISKKCKVKIKKIKSNAKLKDKVILEGSCRLRKDAPGESIFKLSHRRLLIENENMQPIVIPLETISCIQKDGTTGMKFLYNNIIQELYYSQIDEIIKLIVENKFEALKYTDNVEYAKISIPNELQHEQPQVIQKKPKQKLKFVDIFILLASLVLFTFGVIMIITSLK